MKTKIIVFVLFIFSVLFLIPLCAAQYYGGYGSYGLFWPSGTTPAEFLENPWVVFIIFFTIFFALIFYSLGKTFKGNLGIPVVLAAALAFMMAAGIQQQFGMWAKSMLIVALVILGLLLLLMLFRRQGNLFGVIAVIIFAFWGFWNILKYRLPLQFLFSLPPNLIEFLDRTSPIGMWLFIISLILVLLLGRRSGGIRIEAA